MVKNLQASRNLNALIRGHFSQICPQPAPKIGNLPLNAIFITARLCAVWQKNPGFLAEEIGELLKTDPDTNLPNYLGNLRAMADSTTIEGIPASREDRRYTVWEYHGPLDKEETRLLALRLAKMTQLILRRG